MTLMAKNRRTRSGATLHQAWRAFSPREFVAAYYATCLNVSRAMQTHVGEITRFGAKFRGVFAAFFDDLWFPALKALHGDSRSFGFGYQVAKVRMFIGMALTAQNHNICALFSQMRSGAERIDVMSMKRLGGTASFADSNLRNYAQTKDGYIRGASLSDIHLFGRASALSAAKFHMRILTLSALKKLTALLAEGLNYLRLFLLLDLMRTFAGARVREMSNMSFWALKSAPAAPTDHFYRPTFFHPEAIHG